MDFCHVCWFRNLHRWIFRKAVFSQGELRPVSNYSVQIAPIAGLLVLSLEYVGLWRACNWRRSHFWKRIGSGRSTILPRTLLDGFSVVEPGCQWGTYLQNVVLIVMQWTLLYRDVSRCTCLYQSIRRSKLWSQRGATIVLFKCSPSPLVWSWLAVVAKVLTHRWTLMSTMNFNKNCHPLSISRKVRNSVQHDPLIHEHSPPVRPDYCTDWNGYGQAAV